MNQDTCAICGKAVRMVNGLAMHVELDLSHPAVLLVVPEIRTIQVSPDVSLKFDIADGWFSLVDADNLGYDELGAVLMGLGDIDALIVALGKLREMVKTSHEQKAF